MLSPLLTGLTVPLPPAPSIFQFSDPLFGTAALENAGFRDVAVEDVPIHYRGKAPRIWVLKKLE
jgi:hypothetical protein